MKRVMLIVSIIVLLLCPLSASALELGFGYRCSETGGNPLFSTVSYGTDDFSASLACLDGHDVLVDVLSQKECSFLSVEAGGAIASIDWSTLFCVVDCMVGLEKDWENFSLSGFCGAQVGLAKLYGIEESLWSLSPICRGQLSWRNSLCAITTYFNMVHPKDRSWKAVYTVGAEAVIPVTNAFSLRMEAWMKASEYWMDQWTMMANRAIEIGLVYQGDSQ